MGLRSSSPVVPSDATDSLKNFADSRLEDEIALQNLQFIRKRAVELAERREQFAWELLGATTVTVVLLFAGSIYKRKDLVIPIAPLIMGIGYQYDKAFGTSENEIRETAEALLKGNQTCFMPVGGPIRFDEVEALRHKF